MACPYWNRIIAELWPRKQETGAGIWAILDGACDERIAAMVEGAGVDHCCLLPGRLDPALAPAAPYLVRLRDGQSFTDFVVSEGWDCHWGTFLQSDASIEELRRHLRQFLHVRDEGGQRLFFRFYDPRVLRVFLPTCTIRELGMFFGPIRRFVTEDEEPAALLEFTLVDGQLEQRRVDLAPGNRFGSAAGC